MSSRTTSRSRLLQLLALFFVFTLVAAACGDDDDEPAASGDDSATSDDGGGAAADDCAVDSLALHEAGKLTIATGEPVFPPWMLDDDPTSGEGFESAVAYALAEEMGFAAEDVQWERTGFDEAIAPGEKDYDFNMQQYSPTAERDEVVDFSVPYYTSQKSVLALGDSPAATATTFEELQAASWGATTGTTDLDYIENELGIEPAVFDTQADVVAAMLAGQIDATVVAFDTAFYLSAVEVDGSVIAGVLPEADGSAGVDGMALLFSDGSPLVSCVDQALTSLREDGSLDALAAEWLQGANGIPDISR